jgi:hypothetical protein
VSVRQLLKPTISQITILPSKMQCCRVHHYFIFNSSITNKAYHATPDPKLSTKVQAEILPWSPPPISILLKSRCMLPMTKGAHTIPSYGQRIRTGKLSNYRTTHGTMVISSTKLNNGLLITTSNPYLATLKSKS